MPRIVLYSAYYGSPEPFNSGIFGVGIGRYPCLVFSNDASLEVPVGVTLKHDLLTGLDANRASRRAKLMPDRFLPNCEWSIYLDNNATLLADPDELIDALEAQDDHALYVTAHPKRNCVYDEADACIKMQQDSPDVIKAQVARYKTDGFPAKAGLPHCAFIVRRHHHPILPTLGLHWYEHVLAYSRRDQLSFPYVARSLGIEPEYLTPDIGPWPLFEWPVFSPKQRRHKSKRNKKKSFWKRNIKPHMPWTEKKTKSKVALADIAAADIYKEGIGQVSVEENDESSLVKYGKEDGFDYEKYRQIQNTGNKIKIDLQWVGRGQIAILACLIKEYAGLQTKFGLCHGTRRGNEQRWFRECLGPDVIVIGTEIADTANDFPDTVQWDFHQENKDWVERADFVYSNSWDHSYDPELAFRVWIRSLRPGGVLLLDWSEGHSKSGVTVMDPFGASRNYLASMLETKFQDLGSVVAVQKGALHKEQQIWTIAFKKKEG